MDLVGFVAEILVCGGLVAGSTFQEGLPTCDRSFQVFDGFDRVKSKAKATHGAALTVLAAVTSCFQHYCYYQL